MAFQTDDFTAQDIDVWLQEAVAVFRAAEGPTVSPLEINFIYQDKKINRMRQAITVNAQRLQHIMQKKDFSIFEHSNEVVYRALITPGSNPLYLGHAFQVPTAENSNFTSTIGIGKEAIKHVFPHATSLLNSADNKTLKTLTKEDYKNTFQKFFFHELGHVLSWTQGLPSKEKDETHLHHKTYSRHSPTDFVHRLHDTIQYNGVNILSDSTQEDYKNHIEEKGLSADQFNEYAQIQTGMPYIAEEMYADCFSVIMSSRLPQHKNQIHELIEGVDNWRIDTNSSPIDLLKSVNQKLENGYVSPNRTLSMSHYTSPALERLNDLIVERHINTESLSAEDIIDLCQECKNYGMTALMNEMAACDENYGKFLKVIPYSRSKKEPDLFGDTGDYSVNIFDYLSETDKNKTLGKKTISQMLAMELVERHINGGDKKLTGTSFSTSLPDNIQKHMEVLDKKVENFLNRNCFSDSKDLVKELFSISYQYVNAVYKNQKYSKVLNISTPTAVPLSSIKDKIKNNRAKNSDNSKELLETPNLWKKEPSQPGSLKDKIQSLARKPIEPVFIFPPKVQSFK